MKRFVTYLYAYKDGEKMKNTGHIRVDVRGNILDMQIKIKDSDLDDVKGTFYIVIRKDSISKIPLVDIFLRGGAYSGKASYNCSIENIIGVGIQYENGSYMASCWKDGEEAVIAGENVLINNTAVIENKVEENQIQEIDIKEAIETKEQIEEKIKVASMEIAEPSLNEIEPIYRKMNLNEIYTLPSHAWHFSNNSFLIHGFWNYGYLVLKETMEENQKRIALGVPGIFEQPEMVMATYFGFPKFETLSSMEMEIEMGQCWSCNKEKKEQQPQAGTFGCWFANL